MITIVDLQTSLLDLLYEIEGSEVNVIIGGGFGIYLKVVHVAKEGRRTLWREWPEPRATNDLDLFLRPELLIESEKLKPLTTERNIYIRIEEDLLWRLRIRIRCAELDTTIQDFVVELLEQELSANATSRRSSASHAARRAAVPGGAARKDKDR